MNYLEDRWKDIYITKNFKWGEFFESDKAKENKLQNIPYNPLVFCNILNLTQNILQPIRDKFGPIQISSGFRSKLLNRLIGGSDTSNHLKGYAADIQPLNGDIKLLDIIEWIYNNCEYKELIAEWLPNGWIHVAYIENFNYNTLKLKDNNHNYNEVSIEYLKGLYNEPI